jgi:iron(III) transport system ATP-binding protein
MLETSGPAALHLAAKSISVRNVDLFYGKFHALKNVSLDIQPGELFAFLGPSGCGKTTLLRLIAGFNTAQSGSVSIGGEDVLRLPPWKRDVGMVFQSYALWPHMTIWKNVAFGLEERRLPKTEIKARVGAALELVGLAHLADRRPSQLSGGQQQRVALARTIAIEPKVLLLDEPLSNLDAKMRVQVRRELRDLQQRLGLTTVFVTHDQEEANTICDRIAVFSDGEIQQVGTPMALYENPRNLFVANFLGTANILAGKVEGTGKGRRFILSDGLSIGILDDRHVADGARLMFRPQSARVGKANDYETSLPGHVAHREFLGASVRYGVSVAGSEVLVDVPFHSGAELHGIGDAVTLALSNAALQWLAE